MFLFMIEQEYEQSYGTLSNKLVYLWYIGPNSLKV